jgi:predicted nucleic acid-binding protein
MIYFDSSYLVRLYFEDAGFQAVRELATSDLVVSAQHGRAEVVAAFHRKMREATVRKSGYQVVLKQFSTDTRAGGFKWLALSEAVLERLEAAFANLPPGLFLRAGDALHLATAAEARLREIYSNDTNLLAAAPHFGLRAIDVIR